MATPGQIIGVGKLITPGGAQGPKGDPGSAIPLADPTQNGLLKQVSGLTTDFVDGTNNCQDLGNAIRVLGPRIYNSFGNPSFEVDQRAVGNPVTVNGFVMDRWYNANTMATGKTTCQQVAATAPVIIPGTNFGITNKVFRITCTTAQAVPAAAENVYFYQMIEGSRMRELISDVHSLSILCRSNVAGLKFGICLRTFAAPFWGISKLCSFSPTASQWTLITLPNIPIWPAGGTWGLTPGSTGYYLFITLTAGANAIPSANDVWVNFSNIGAIGQGNLMTAVNNYADFAFVQHETGPNCNQLQDVDFERNLRSCQRYYCKSSGYAVKACQGGWVGVGIMPASSGNGRCTIRFPVEMAKVPTMRYTGNSAVLGNIYTDGNGLIPVSSSAPTTSGVGQLNSSTVGPAAASAMLADWDADTGW